MVRRVGMDGMMGMGREGRGRLVGRGIPLGRGNNGTTGIGSDGRGRPLGNDTPGNDTPGKEIEGQLTRGNSGKPGREIDGMERLGIGGIGKLGVGSEGTPGSGSSGNPGLVTMASCQGGPEYQSRVIPAIWGSSAMAAH